MKFLIFSMVLFCSFSVFSQIDYLQDNPKSNFLTNEKASNKFGPVQCKDCKPAGYQAALKEIKEALRNSIKIEKMDFKIYYDIGGDYKKAEHEVCGKVTLLFKKPVSVYFHIGFIQGTEIIWTGENNFDKKNKDFKKVGKHWEWVTESICLKLNGDKGRGKIVLQFLKTGDLLESYFVWDSIIKTNKIRFWLTPGIDHHVRLKWENIWGGLEMEDFNNKK